ncbi:MAG: radical SAM protein [Treponemataceae bacterium]|nr:MAG: radical SAM protein [Treponemataceae bacterium]
MNMETYKTPTGNICIMQGELGKPLEFLSLGDYGKEKNIKADFMGITREINGVPHSEPLPLEKKWVITISTQYGCSMGCKFCDVPKVGPGVNATFSDLVNQVKNALSLHPEVKRAERINLHYARMGEPTWNDAVIDSAYYLKGMFDSMGWGFHPVVSTVMPRYCRALFIYRWLELKEKFNGEAGLQISINTTDYNLRRKMMPQAVNLTDIHDTLYPEVNRLTGRKIALNFALTDAPIDAKELRRYFDPEYFMCKITPMHNTKAVIENGMMTDGGYDFYYPYKQVEEDLKAQGFDVIVFIPSKEEDESRITCGNAILADKKDAE